MPHANQRDHHREYKNANLRKFADNKVVEALVKVGRTAADVAEARKTLETREDAAAIATAQLVEAFGGSGIRSYQLHCLADSIQDICREAKREFDAPVKAVQPEPARRTNAVVWNTSVLDEREKKIAAEVKANEEAAKAALASSDDKETKGAESFLLDPRCED